MGQARAQTRDTPCPQVRDTGLVRPCRARLKLRTVFPEAGWTPSSLGRGPKARVRPRAVSAVCSSCRFEPREPPQAHPPWEVLETQALPASRPGRSNGPGRCCVGRKVCHGYRRGNHEMKINVAEAPRSLRAAEKTAEITAAMTLLYAHGCTCRLPTRGFLRPLRLERGRF